MNFTVLIAEIENSEFVPKIQKILNSVILNLHYKHFKVALASAVVVGLYITSKKTEKIFAEESYLTLNIFATRISMFFYGCKQIHL